MKLNNREIKGLAEGRYWAINYLGEDKLNYWNGLSQEEKANLHNRAVHHLDFFEGFSGTLEEMNVHFIEGEDEDFEEYLQGAENFIVGDYSYTCVDSHGGEGEGSSFWRVYKVETLDKPDRFFKFSGYYASHDGSYLENVDEVKPEEKTITVYN